MSDLEETIKKMLAVNVETINTAAKTGQEFIFLNSISDKFGIRRTELNNYALDRYNEYRAAEECKYASKIMSMNASLTYAIIDVWETGE